MASKQSALEQVLEALHTDLANELLARIRKGEATATDLSVARQFLKDNGIDALATPGSAVLNLAEGLPVDVDDDDDGDEGGSSLAFTG